MALAVTAWSTAAVSSQVSFLGARSAALGGATSALVEDVWGQANPAAWGQVSGRVLALHGAQLYGMRELRFASMLALASFGRGALAIGATTFGFELYRTTSVDAGVGLRAGPGTHRTISVGLRTRWETVEIARYGRSAALSWTVGMQLPLTPFITLGAVAHYLAAAGRRRSEVPRRLALGIAFRRSEAFAVTADVGKGVRSPLSMATGVEIGLVRALLLRGGASFSPMRAAGGIGLRLSHLTADVAFVRHHVLGWSPSLSVLFTW